jgi:pseudouridine synthase, RluA family
MINVEIGDNERNQRLDKFLRKYLGEAPLSYIYKAIRKDVKVNGKRSKGEYVLQSGDNVSIYISDADFAKFQRKPHKVGAKRQFGIAYEDDNILVVEKPFGLLTHGDSTEKRNHLANQVIDYLIEEGDYNPRLEKTFTPAPVNRLDRNTTGLVIFCKNYPALQAFNSMIREKGIVNKYYLTIVPGKLDRMLHLSDKMIKNESTNTITVVDSDAEGKTMETIARPLSTNGKYTLCEVEIITGRTHQIRAHLAKAGYPVIGDVKYGDKEVNKEVRRRFDLTTQLLHAYKLRFDGCAEGFEYLDGKEIKAKMPEEFEKILKGIGLENGK